MFKNRESNEVDILGPSKQVNIFDTVSKNEILTIKPSKFEEEKKETEIKNKKRLWIKNNKS